MAAPTAFAMRTKDARKTGESLDRIAAPLERPPASDYQP
jgi:hypothetical protein